MLRNGWDELDALGQKGDWAFFNGGKMIVVRYGRAVEDTVALHIHKAGETPKEGVNSWEWDGAFDAPTLSPSILVHGAPGEPDLWHGYLRNGRLEE